MAESAGAASRWRLGDAMGSMRVRALLGLAALVALATPGTYAHWTDEVQVGGTTVTAGTIDLQVDGLDQVSGYTQLDLDPMVPGNSTATVLAVKNTGTAPLAYTATSSATDPEGKGLAGALRMKVTAGLVVTGVPPAESCGGDVLAGTTDFLGAAVIATPRILAPGATDKVCVQIMLPTDASSALQGATSQVTFAFTGTSDVS